MTPFAPVAVESDEWLGDSGAGDSLETSFKRELGRWSARPRGKVSASHSHNLLRAGRTWQLENVSVHSEHLDLLSVSHIGMEILEKIRTAIRSTS